MHSIRFGLLGLMAIATVGAVEIADDSVQATTTAQLDLQVQIADSTSAYPVLSYYAPDDAGSPWGQDHSGSASLSESGNGLSLSGNAWKTVEVDYPVTAGTTIDLTFDSAVASQAQGIALMAAEGASVIPMVQLGGYEVWPNGSQGYNTHVPGGGSITYSIPIGSLITEGTYKYLVLINDDDDAVSSDAALSWIWIRDEEVLDLAANAQRTNPDNVRVQWQAITGSEWYQLTRQDTTVSNQIMVNLLGSEAIHLNDTSASSSAAADLRYDVVALKDNGGVAEQLDSDVDVVPTDLGLTAVRESDTSIRVQWNAVTNADYYLLDRKTETVDNQVMIIFLPETAVEYLDQSVVAATNYVYNVFAGLPALIGNT